MATLKGLHAAAALKNKSFESFAHQKDDFIAWCEVRKVSATKPTCSAR